MNGGLSAVFFSGTSMILPTLEIRQIVESKLTTDGFLSQMTQTYRKRINGRLLVIFLVQEKKISKTHSTYPTCPSLANIEPELKCD